jgi:hypothetical protein
VGRRLDGVVEEADGRGAAGNGRRRGRPAAGAEMGRGRRKETAPTGGPHLSAAEREGRWEAGVKWAAWAGSRCGPR